MATREHPILGWPTRPGSDDVFSEPYDIKATNDAFGDLVYVFNDTSARDGLSGRFHVPQGYVGAAKINVYWTAAQITGDVEWDFDYRAIGGNDTESLDQAGTQESVNQNDTAPSAAQERMKATLTLTAGNFAAGDTVRFTLFRDGTDAGDTLAGYVLIDEVMFEYSDA